MGTVLILLSFLTVIAVGAVRIVSGRFSSNDSSANSEWTRGNASANLAALAAQAGIRSRPQTSRPVYPYSVVPGGVQSPEDLKQASDHDPIVAQHYAGFDYQRARVIEVQEPKLVYLSYRLHDRIYWTSKLIRLRRGEKLISDGKMTARTRCGNRVSEAAQKAVSPEEPPAEKFDQPFLADGGTSTQAPFPGTFASTLRNDPTFDGAGPAGPPLTTSYLFGPGGSSGYGPIFPPPIPTTAGACDLTHPGPAELTRVDWATPATRGTVPKSPAPAAAQPLRPRSFRNPAPSCCLLPALPESTGAIAKRHPKTRAVQTFRRNTSSVEGRHPGWRTGYNPTVHDRSSSVIPFDTAKIQTVARIPQ